jgi:hypothetical protein
VNHTVILRSQRAWPWGVVCVSDARSRQELPLEFGDRVVVGVETALVSRILHEVDGEATAEVWFGEPPEDLRCVYDAAFLLPSGVVTLGDASENENLSASTDRSVGRARVFADDTQHPQRVVALLSGQ